MRNLPLALFGLSALASVGCGDDDASSVGSGGGGGGGGSGGMGGAAGGCPIVGATECEGPLVRTCESGSDGLEWSLATECPGEQRCRDGACAHPTPEQLAQAETAATYVTELVGRTAWHLPLDAAAMAANAREEILDGDGSNLAFFTAMRGVHLAVPQGHQSLFSDRCGSDDMPYQVSSRFGVCARPYQDHLVVTYAKPGNALGLSAGDRVVRADTDEGVDMLEAAARRPVCGVSSPSDAHRRGAAASSFFATVPAKAELEIEPAAGTTFTVTIPDTADSVLTDCQDPLGRNIQFDADSYVRSDGVAVVRIPRFYPLNGTLPPNPTQAELDAFIAAFQAEVQLAFDAVKDAPQLIWDARSNFGGITLVGLAIAGGMPTSTAMDLSYCEARVPFSDPPALYQGTYAQYSVAPGGPFAYSGDVAVLIDDHDYSAADYFPLAVARATQSILVGTPTAGAYGGSGELRELGGTPEMFFTADPNRCSDADGEPLEGLSVEPDLYVEYAPEDLAAGVDTVMEAAAAALLAP